METGGSAQYHLNLHDDRVGRAFWPAAGLLPGVFGQDMEGAVSEIPRCGLPEEAERKLGGRAEARPHKN